jgi:class 3 adenylate cyclase
MSTSPHNAKWFQTNASIITSIQLAIIGTLMYTAIVPNWVGLILISIDIVKLYLISKGTAIDSRQARITRAFQGKIGTKQLKNWLTNNPKGTIGACEQVVTLMFVDIAGFSRSSHDQTPQAAFQNLQVILSEISKTVHDNGGVVDKSLGDGLLCYFGVYYEGIDYIQDHADRAVKCGIEIQRNNAERIIQANINKDPVYPLRIGINTSPVYIGDVGYGDRVDFTVIGHGVNVANRLENACDNNLIMIGSSTKELLSQSLVNPSAIQPKLVIFKHQEKATQTFELHPFWDDKDLLYQANQAYRQHTGKKRVQTRWLIPEQTKMFATSDFGETKVINFSKTGLQLQCDSFIAKNTIITLTIDSSDPRFKESLHAIGLTEIKVKVKWGVFKDEKYLHGVSFVELNEFKLHSLFTCIRDSIFRTTSSSEIEQAA